MMPVFTAYGPMSNILKKQAKSIMGGFTQPVSWGQVEARTDLFFKKLRAENKLTE